jgi:tetratricopeptide (TPR) repeat protein
VQLTQGLDALHEIGKIHRDIKPSNVLVTPAGRVVILDFGLAVDVARDRLESEAPIAGGTVDYMAPEQACMGTLGPPADWYSVGVVLYQVLTGRLPFSGTVFQVVLQKQEQVPPSPKSLGIAAPADLEDLCMRLLHFNPAERPTAREILARLGVVSRASAPDRSTSSEGAVFVGRARELATLAEAYASAAGGETITVLVRGVSGIGKSALIRRFLQDLRRESDAPVVLSGRCYERESMPYKAFDGVVDAMSRWLVRLPKGKAAPLLPEEVGLVAQAFPVLRRVDGVSRARVPHVADPHVARSTIFTALREMLRNIGRIAPCVVVIDDLQWADADSMMLLGDLLRPPDAPPLLLLAGIREDADLDRDLLSKIPGTVREVQVAALPPAEARTLCERLACEPGGEEAPVDADAIAGAAGGHPLFIDALVRHALAVGERDPGAVRLEDALWARVEALDARVRVLLELIVISGAPLSQEVAARAAELDIPEFAKAAAVLRVRHLARTRGARARDAIEPYHNRIRTTVLERLDAGATKARHLCLVEALEGSGNPDAEALAIHCHAAGQIVRAAGFAAMAASQAYDVLAFERAVRLYRTALEWSPEGAGVRELHLKLGEALARLGLGLEAAREFDAALPGAAPIEALELQRRAGDELLRIGRFEEGLKVLSHVLEAGGVRVPASPFYVLVLLVLRRIYIALRGLRFRERTEAEISPSDLARIDACWVAASTMGMVDAIRGAYFQSLHLILALRAGEPRRVFRALSAEVIYLAIPGTHGRGRAARLAHSLEGMAERLAPLPKTSNRQWWHAPTAAHARGYAAAAACLEGRWRLAVELAERSEREAREVPYAIEVWALHQMRLFALTSLAYLGRLVELHRLVPLRLREAEERGDHAATTDLRSGSQTLAWLCVDDVESARSQVKKAIHEWPIVGFHIQHFRHLLAQVQIALYTGDSDEAMRLVNARWGDLHRSTAHRIQLVRIIALDLRGRAALAAARTNASERPALLRLARRQAAALEREKAHWANPLAALLGGLVRVARDDPEGAITSLRSAIAGFDAAEMALHGWAARRRLADLVTRAEAEPLLAAADGWSERERIANPARLLSMVAPAPGD